MESLLANNTGASSIFENYVEKAEHFLNLIANLTTAKASYSEKCRRTLIDILVYSALGIHNHITNYRREICVEDALFTEKIPTVPNQPNEIIGSGPLDYTIPEGVLITRGEEVEQEVTENISENESDAELEELPEEQNPFVDIEAKVTLQDKSLYQLLGQLHDSMYVVSDQSGTKRKAEVDEGKHGLVVKRPKVVGILTTGHRWEVYTMSHNFTENKFEVRYVGCRSVKILRYLIKSDRTISFFVNSTTETITIERNELKTILRLLLAVFRGNI